MNNLKNNMKSEKRMAKNTIFLYFRALLSMILNFYTTRLLLLSLGVVDFGLVNVIGSLVAMFSMISSVMNIATSRYYNYEMGSTNCEGLRKLFNVCVQLYVCFIIFVIILSESIGLWILNNNLNIPNGREFASSMLFQLSILTTIFGIATLPYSAMVIANEDMSYYAWISIFEALIKLICVFFLIYISYDHLILYGLILLVINITQFFSYVYICTRKYSACRFMFVWETKKMKELLGFGAWNLWGAGAGLCCNALINILLNNFFGVVVNAARTISIQISSGSNIFVSNFIMACNPRIVKYYAAGEIIDSHSLTIRASRYCFMLFWIVGAPLWLLLPEVLELWLINVPVYTVTFSRLVLIQVLIDSVSFPLMTLAQASGRIALYQAVVGGMMIMTYPLSWIAILLSDSPEACFYVSIFVSCICLILRLLLVRRSAGLPIGRFMKLSLFPCMMVSIFSIMLILVGKYCLEIEIDSLASLWIYLFELCTIVVVMSVGITGEERNRIICFIKNKFFYD